MLTIRTRLVVAFLALVGLGFYALTDWILDDLRPRYLEAMEESMVDTATLLSSLVASQMKSEGIDAGDLRPAFDAARRRRFAAKIYDMTKTHLEMRVYITDRQGVVIFDSDDGRDEGKDYSRWNDVFRTLKGEYGARTTRVQPDDPASEILYVASPIEVDGDIVGVLTVCKPSGSVHLFLEAARTEISVAGIIAAVAVVGLGVVLSIWVTHPIEQLTHYVQAIRDGKRVAAPRLGGEIGVLGSALEEMRTALEGKQYIEEYVQTLTHQMKSPLSAIRGAAELLEEDMPSEQRRQFLENLRSESGRIQDLVERLLQLSSLENRKALRDVEEIDVGNLLAEAVAGLAPVLSGRKVQIFPASGPPVVIKGERFLVRQAVTNLLQNAVDFSEPDGAVTIAAEQRNGEVEIRVLDDGPGVPEYALDKVFERFYSLRRPATGKTSSGLGLAFVKEVATLHGGRAALENRPEGGAKATLVLPVEPESRLV